MVVARGGGRIGPYASPERPQGGRRPRRQHGRKATASYAKNHCSRGLVAPHSEDDRLTRGSTKDREPFGIDEYFDAAGGSRGAPNPTASFQRQHHLVSGGWGYGEMALDVGLGGGTAMNARIGVDEGQVLPLLGRKAGRGESDRQAVRVGIPFVHERTLPRESDG